ncbi:O-antigen ligase family protein [Aureibaculum sp. 2210JD6-5]|uniref:O-antigen ligase family protein n=1 Tax=Aureibaculum sp. 2210JD6-5 TaxID=3103957 RepID=UPI002AAEC39B|nr:O-antigen ligase family protein [Aureibaculum sp. 2210JD6-5]MDY7394198.1 O-antigen ligase family protein [Aureibaculum sp. 2210JD6-5]
MKINYKIKLLFNDLVFRLLVLNMFWVILGYALVSSLGIFILPYVRSFKLIFVISSLILVLYRNGLNVNLLINKWSIFLVILGVSILAFFAENPFPALYKSLTFVYPLLYIIFSINYLLRFGAFNLLIALSLGVLIVYAMVPLTYFIFGQGIGEINIYGSQTGDFFFSNHYGWGSSLFILSALTILRYYPLKSYLRLTLYLYLPFVFYLLIISGNRSGLLSVLIALVFLIFKDSFIKSTYKIYLIFGTIVIYGFIAIQDNSIVEFLQEKNKTQIETGQEARLIGTNAMLRSFDHNPVHWFTGVGMFDYTELRMYGGVLSSYHNSYWEILFGAGIAVFLLFLYFMIIHPFRIFWKVTSNYSLLIFPLILIPFFESNLTAGQFLFFPWFTYMTLMNAKEFNFYVK